MSNINIATFIDHTLLKADSTLDQAKLICKEALEHRFAAVCVSPYFTKEAAQILLDSGIKMATVVGFPMGFNVIPAKVEEIKKAIHEGTDELDVVINLNAVKSQNWSYVRNEIDTIVMATHLHGKKIKVILETGLLTADEIKRLCDICNPLMPDFVKTSTGMNGNGATPEIVKILKSYLDPKIKIKASGGIKTLKDALALIEAGAHRIGTSSAIAMLAEQNNNR